MILPDNINKYFGKYALDGWVVEWTPFPVTTIVVIPAIKEQKNIEILLSSLYKLEKKYLTSALFLFVINNTSSSAEEVKKENASTIQYLRKLISNPSGVPINIGLIDASSPGKELNEKEGGVGLARKIGMDESLKLFNYNSPLPKILVCLDADCEVSSNYLTGINEHFYSSGSEAASIYFEHAPEPLTEAIIVYEIFLRYYVNGLRYSKSPYAFHTIGSSMACTAESYIKIEGMNKKKAAEDFYFLEKLAKHTKISSINNITVFPSPRGSWRVPFGTGQRINRYHANTHDEYLLYDPEIFRILKEWLLLLNQITGLTPEIIHYKSKDIHPELAAFLEQNKFISDWSNILKSSRSPEQVNKQKDRWFDGFKTLKLVHYLRDNAFPNIDMFRTLNKFFAMSGISIDFTTEEKIPSYETRLLYLQTLRKLDRNSDT